MQIVDLRQIQARVLDPLFQEETRHWRDELHWDYRSSIELIRRFIDSRSLDGYVAMEDGSPAGYGFYVLEDHKELIGGLFISSRFSQEPYARARNRNRNHAARHSASGTRRSPADALRHRTRSRFSLAVFRTVHAPVHVADARRRQLGGALSSTGLRLEPWTDRAFESAARLIQLGLRRSREQ